MTNKLEYVKIKNMCSSKSIIKKVKRQPTGWEKIAQEIGNKGLIPHLYK